MEEHNILNGLNDKQREAVLNTEGPLLILAGAGSGKTRVIVHRIVHLIEACGVRPGQILAITFTNKAAAEMRERVDKMVGFGAQEIWVMTFHAFCVRVLRRHGELLGYTRYFSIYDTDDQVALMKDIFKRKNIDSKMMKEKAVLHVISSAKDELISPEKFMKDNAGDFRLAKIGELYKAYQTALKENNAVDFDDIIVETVRLFRERPDVLALYQDHFPYQMIDEYQDTNNAQFELVRLLSEKYRNICVVGDDDQSIYKFRGANIGNILGFENQFTNAHVVRLEQNYRSTQTILDAANAVIANNVGRKKKRLWTDNGQGTPITMRRFMNGFEEAEYVVGEFSSKVRNGECLYKDCAILYRTNAQSRLFEEKFLMANIPYRIVGGTNFYSRKEIKDILAYLKTVDNAVDGVAVRRIINVPKRSIGAATLTKIADYAEDGGMTFYEAAREADLVPGLGRSAAKVLAFTDFIERMRENSRHEKVSELIKTIIDKTGYLNELKEENTEESLARIENIDELISKAVTYEEGAESPSLSGFLEEVALIADIDTVEDSDDKVLLMTLHSAKGLEFDNVAIVGMEDGLFPSYMAMNAEDSSDMEEERRLAYVGITRAKKHLTITCARERMVRGEVQMNPMSRFIQEIPRELVDVGYEKPNRDRMSSFEMPSNNSYARMKEAFRTKAYGAQRQQTGAYSQQGTYSRNSVYSSLDNDLSNGGAVEPGRYSAGNVRPSVYGGGQAFNSRNLTAMPSEKSGQTAPSAAAPGNAASLGYDVGDTVRHTRFGEGVVTDIRSGGRDYEITVDFNGTVKKMFASFARLRKV